ncbi:MAG: RagB/SusD family nutrient uptake outer membrane protein [Balneolaceae bacterium]|nr:RagB/SusD family nutrient uptake outer membrane protein [Balneolaceae bacterium]
MKLIRLLVIVSMLGVVFGSCEEQVLNKETQDRFTENDIWGDVNLARSYLNKVYQGVGGWGITSDNGPREMPSSATDEAMQRGDHGVWILNNGEITASNYGTFNKWSDNYEAIRRCNIFLQNIDNVPNVDPDEIELMKPQVRFIRAKLYADLVNWYSWWEGEGNGVPLITEPFDLEDDFNVERANYSEVVNFIVTELDAVASILPEEWNAENWGRITKGAAFALKSEILLYAASQRHNQSMDQSKWQQASDAAKAVIDMNMYSLNEVNSWQDYANIF